DGDKRQEQHVQENRQRYAEKLSAVIDILQQAITIEAPAGGFCLWLPTPCHSVDFVESLYREQSVIALPGSYLARDNRQQHNPGEQFIRVALVAAKNDCIEASHRLVEHYQAVSG
ncbi:aminotransferase class I/II-fold pyridoxal phosphate-dependent enzyme, partial [bacterium]|nr:aminotransferase class I/II-fold pyridoxal phosphate-dependent enzyme [bacterium]